MGDDENVQKAGHAEAYGAVTAAAVKKDPADVSMVQYEAVVFDQEPQKLCLHCYKR